MSVEQNKRIIQRYLEEISGHPKPRATMDKYISDQDEDLKKHIEVFETAFPCYILATKEIVAEADKVFVSFVFEGTQEQGFMGIPASNKHVSVPGTICYHMEEGKIVSHDMVVDTLSLMQQLGAVPEMAG